MIFYEAWQKAEANPAYARERPSGGEDYGLGCSDGLPDL